MRSTSLPATALLISLAMARPAGAQTAPVSRPTDCEAADGIAYICDQKGTEDLVRVPGSNWVIASWVKGGIGAINTRTRQTYALYPDIKVAEMPNRKLYGDCPGPPDAGQKALFMTAGIAVRTGKRGIHTLYATHFTWKRGIDVFTLDVRPKVPKLTWNGCVDVPDGVGIDALVPIANNGFIITNWAKPGPDFPAERRRIEAGVVNGELWQWAPGKGWKIVPGSRMSGPNGLEISADKRTLYVAAWGSKELVRMTRTAVPKVARIAFDFRPDNVRWAPDGALLIAGPNPATGGTGVARIDPHRLRTLSSFSLPTTTQWGTGSTALQVGKDLWIAAFRSDRIAVVPVDRK